MIKKLIKKLKITDNNFLSHLKRMAYLCLIFQVIGCGINLPGLNSIVDDNRATLGAPGLSVASLGLNGLSGNGASGGSRLSLSENGRYLAYESNASNLVLGDTNGVKDIFVYDHVIKSIRRVSISSNGVEANGDSSITGISHDGNVIVFTSDASNLVEGDTNAARDIFLHDLDTRETKIVSTDVAGDLADGDSDKGRPSRDGRYIAFESLATNLIAGDSNARSDIFLKDMETGLITLLSQHTDGTPSDNHCYDPKINANATAVAFWCRNNISIVDGDTTNQDAFVRLIDRGETHELSRDENGGQSISGSSYSPNVDASGSLFVFHGSTRFTGIDDYNGEEDVYLKNVDSETISRISLSQNGIESDGRSYNATLSDDGKFISFNTRATNLIDGEIMPGGYHQAVVKNLTTGEVLCVSRSSTDNSFANADSPRAVMSGDGSTIAFISSATNLSRQATDGFENVYIYRFF